MGRVATRYRAHATHRPGRGTQVACTRPSRMHGAHRPPFVSDLSLPRGAIRAPDGLRWKPGRRCAMSRGTCSRVNVASLPRLIVGRSTGFMTSCARFECCEEGVNGAVCDRLSALVQWLPQVCRELREIISRYRKGFQETGRCGTIHVMEMGTIRNGLSRRRCRRSAPSHLSWVTRRSRNVRQPDSDGEASGNGVSRTRDGCGGVSASAGRSQAIARGLLTHHGLMVRPNSQE